MYGFMCMCGSVYREILSWLEYVSSFLKEFSINMQHKLLRGIYQFPNEHKNISSPETLKAVERNYRFLLRLS